MASAASTAPTNPLVSTIPSASRGISCVLTFLVVEIKVELLVSGANLSPRARRIKNRGQKSEQKPECRTQESEFSDSGSGLRPDSVFRHQCSSRFNSVFCILPPEF